MQIQDIPIDQIKPDPNQPRNFIDKSGIRELADSIKNKGLLEEILVRPKNESFQIVHGERRWQACILLKAKTIRAKVKTLSNKDAFEISLIENIQREDLNLEDEARAIKKLTDSGLTQKEAGQRIGKTRGYVAKKLLVLRDLERLDEIETNRVLMKDDITKFKEDVRRRTVSPDLLRSAIKAHKTGWIVYEIIGGSPTVRKARDIASKKSEKEQEWSSRENRRSWTKFGKIKEEYLKLFKKKRSEYLGKLSKKDRATFEVIQQHLKFAAAHYMNFREEAERFCDRWWPKICLDIFTPKRTIFIWLPRGCWSLEFNWWVKRKDLSVEELVEVALATVRKIVELGSQEREKLFKKFNDDFRQTFPDTDLAEKENIGQVLGKIPQPVWRKMHRSLVRTFHPDKGGNPDIALWVNKLHEGMKLLRDWK